MGLKLAYLGLSFGVIFLLIFISRYTLQKTFSDPRVIRRKLLMITSGLLLWQIYMYLIALTGWLQDFSWPPKLPILIIFPLFLFTGVFLYRNRNHEWIRNIPPHWLIFFQSFRILVETIFVLTLAKGMIHINMTIEGYNYDMVFGFSAPIVGYFIYRKVKHSRKLGLIWNYTGLAVLLSVIIVAMTTTYFPSVYGSQEYLMPKEFGIYPYTLVAGFLMPVAVFIHILSIIQLTRIKPQV